MTQLRIHDVTKIEVKKLNKGNSYICRDLVIHTEKYNYELNKYVKQTLSIDLFLKDSSASKLVYSKEIY